MSSGIRYSKPSILGRRRSARPAEIAVTGLGPTSALGCDVDSFWSSIVAGRVGIGQMTGPAASASASRVAAQVDDADLERHLPRRIRRARHLPRATRLALAAAAAAWEDADLDHDPHRIGVVVGTSVGPLGEILDQKERVLEGQTPPGGSFPFFHFAHSTACVIASEWDLQGPLLTVSTGCNSTFDAVGVARHWLECGQADAVLVVGTDSELFPDFVAAMDRAGALSRRWNHDPAQSSRPFDARRDGNVLGEGAGALVLERAVDASARRRSTYALVRGQTTVASGRRRYSATAPDASSRPALLGLNRLLEGVGWRPTEIDAVHANGSSSKVYDALEARVLRCLFEAESPAIHSVKSMLGQHGAGSSALQWIASCCAIRHGTLPPTVNLEEPDASCDGLDLVTAARPSAPSRVLIHAIGFGGFYYSSAALRAA